MHSHDKQASPAPHGTVRGRHDVDRRDGSVSEVVRTLQRSAGNAAVVRALATAGHRPVQRFFTQNVDTAAGTGPHFTMQSPVTGLFARAQAPAGELPWEIGHETAAVSPAPGNGVPMQVSDRLDLAVHNAPSAEPKEFYGDRAVFERSAQRLAEVGSFVRLQWTSPTIEVGDGRNRRTLNRIVPVPAEDAANRFDGGVKDECIEFARLVMGGTRRRQVPRLLRTGQRYSEAAALKLAQAVTPPGFDTDPVAAYSAAHRAGALTGLPEAGLNEFADPDVGEAFNYTTLVSDDADAAGSLPDDIWGYHFAAVVARSGDDRVTLENYKRSAEAAVAQLHAVLIRRYRERTNALVRQWHRARYRGRYDAEFAPVGPPMKAVLRLLEKEAAQVGADGQREFRRLTEDGLRGERWFFRMYGRGPGQSFHEQKLGTAADHGGRTHRITMGVGIVNG